MYGKERKVVLYIASSLDGYIARENGDIDWLDAAGEVGDEDYGYGEFYKSVDTIIMGRKTYEQVLTFGKWPYSGKKCYVFTESEHFEDANVEFTSENVENFIGMLKKEKGKDIWLVGGSQIIGSFLERDLVDEFIITIIPLLLGCGIPLFKTGAGRGRLNLLGNKAYGDILQVRYSIARQI